MLKNMQETNQQICICMQTPNMNCCSSFQAWTREKGMKTNWKAKRALKLLLQKWVQVSKQSSKYYVSGETAGGEGA